MFLKMMNASMIKKTFFHSSLITISLIPLGYGMDPEPMTEAERRAANLLNWSEPLSTMQPELRSIPGIDFEKIRVLSFDKIVKDICPNQSEFLLSLAQTKSQEEWDRWCHKFVIESGSFVVDKKNEQETPEDYEEHKSSYLNYVCNEFKEGYRSLLCRQTAIMFFCAFEYFKKSHSNAVIKLVYTSWNDEELVDVIEDGGFGGDITDKGCELCVCTVNGKWPEECCHLDFYTLPYFTEQQEVYSGLVEITEDKIFLGFCTFWHELGHLWHGLLNIDLVDIDFQDGLKCELVRNLFFPALTGDNIDAAQMLIKDLTQGVLNSTDKTDKEKWLILTEYAGLPNYIDGNETTYKASLSSLQWENLLEDRFYFNLVWATFEEIFQICGLSSNGLLINPFCDICFFAESRSYIRWGHCTKHVKGALPPSFVNCCPKKENLAILLKLLNIYPKFKGKFEH